MPTPTWMNVRCHRAFTLIELLVVMAILGILSVVGIGTFTSSQQKGRDARRLSDLTQIVKSLETYLSDHGTYPSHSVSGEMICRPSEAVPADRICNWGKPFQDNTGTTYMSQLPEDPKGGKYLYLSLDTNADSRVDAYDLFIRLENIQHEGLTAGIDATCGIGGMLCNYVVTSPNHIYNTGEGNSLP